MQEERSLLESGLFLWTHLFAANQRQKKVPPAILSSFLTQMGPPRCLHMDVIVRSFERLWHFGARCLHMEVIVRSLERLWHSHECLDIHREEVKLCDRSKDLFYIENTKDKFTHTYRTALVKPDHWSAAIKAMYSTYFTLTFDFSSLDHFTWPHTQQV